MRLRIFLKSFSLLIFLVFILSLFVRADTSFDQDLGRHIKLGEIITTDRFIPRTNLFSYTNSDFRFINHHWLSEVIFYSVFSWLGNNGLYVFRLVLLLTPIVVVLFVALSVGSLATALLASVGVLVLVGYRDILRPELFGYLFFAIYLLCAVQILIKRRFYRWFYLIPFIQVVWVNLHVTFVYGYVLLGLMVLYGAVSKFMRKEIFFIVFLSALLGFVNPYGMEGLFYPLQILQNYGYQIQENQNLFFLYTFTSDPYIRVLAVSLVFSWLSVGGVFYLAVRKNKLLLFIHRGWFLVVLAVIFSILTVSMIRNIIFYTFSMWVLLSFGFHFVTGEKLLVFGRYKYTQLLFSGVVGIWYLMGIVLISTNIISRKYDMDNAWEWGMKENYRRGVDFFLSERRAGRVFNNFDIGGYLDFRLYPEHSVFVDNRPEAYPDEFFDTYRKLLMEADTFNTYARENDIGTIVFSHTDMTPWGEQFIASLAKYTNYQVVYFDPYMIILSRDGEALEEAVYDSVIDASKSSMELMQLAHFFTLTGDTSRFDKSLNRAYMINPDSCSISYVVGSRYLTSGNLVQRRKGKQIIDSAVGCFYNQKQKEWLKQATGLL